MYRRQKKPPSGLVVPKRKPNKPNADARGNKEMGTGPSNLVVYKQETPEYLTAEKAQEDQKAEELAFFIQEAIQIPPWLGCL